MADALGKPAHAEELFKIPETDKVPVLLLAVMKTKPDRVEGRIDLDG
jgi:hypothetical protein